jgi:hypothetical protein
MAICGYRREIANKALVAIGGVANPNMTERDAKEYSGLLLIIMKKKNIEGIDAGLRALERAYASSRAWCSLYDEYLEAVEAGDI